MLKTIATSPAALTLVILWAAFVALAVYGISSQVLGPALFDTTTAWRVA